MTVSTARRRLGSRTAALTGSGPDVLERLGRARVLVVGAGGLGAPVVAYLAGSGLGRLTIVDDDVVDGSNLARQTLFTTADVGVAKAEVAAARARAVDPELDVVAVVGRFRPEHVAGHDVVVDAADAVDVTRAISDACAPLGIPFVWGTVLAYDGQVSVFRDAGDDGVDFHDLHPEVLPDEGSCAVDGVLPALCGAVGSVMAAQVTALVAGLGDPLLGRLLTVDARRWRWTESPIRRGPASRRPTGLPAGAAGAAAAGGPAPAAPRIAPAALAARLANPADTLTLVDVRTPEEWATGVIAGSVHGDAVLPDGDVVVTCARGPRADAWARTVGRPVTVLDGGIDAWRREGRPLTLE
ncbi:ThiF family adenylyltransferase [Curtobacterium herbarum]|uniref:Adenylyltransferase/sulfurtransferase MoeZ n=1 Tax=Curtobacterium herbarum TaxID=150122 RepID=A0ABN1ZFH3_9MICO|nr:ThiF family adenylyltransferase [Curtobacterium herbarum]MBM7474520.1 adenylyltransferase/sulfurtransferase [Curtobacterium herbarum]MCS6545904.1 ThiF family adenylyltransferase [Curtobacterium herbarum]